MQTTVKFLAGWFWLSAFSLSCGAQCVTNTNDCAQGVPHLIKFSGELRNPAGSSPAGILSIKFAVYAEAVGGTPLWQEVQNVGVDQQGHYGVMLGESTTGGVPTSLFSSGEPRWLGVQVLLPEADEQPRVLMVSVPYALEAADAQTLGGLPASAFLRANSGAAPETALIPSVTGSPAAASTPATSAASAQAREANLESSGSALANPQAGQSGAGGSILFADQFAGGVPDAVQACPAAGCLIYAYSPNINLSLGTIDPGAKTITIYLGPYTYTVKQITLRTGLKIIGAGDFRTTLQSVNGNDPVIVVPQTNLAPATGVLLSGLNLQGSAGNTSEDAIFLDASQTVASGLWFSTFDDIVISGFSGIGIHLRARSNDYGSTDQWLLFSNIWVNRTAGGGNALSLEGSVFELRFRNCLFQGKTIGDGTNVYVGGFGGGIIAPLNVAFDGLVSQSAALAVQIDGAIHLTFSNSHHENLWAGYQVTGNTGIATYGLTITESDFSGNVGINGGAGFDLNVATANASGIVFSHNQIFGNPDAVLKGTNASSVVYKDNLYTGSSTVPPTSWITTQIAPAPTINIQGAHSVGLNPSTTPITTIQSSLGPGEMVTLFTFAGPVTFASGGNINLMGQSSLLLDGSITLVRNDLLGSLQWTPVAQWNKNPSLRANGPGFHQFVGSTVRSK